MAKKFHIGARRVYEIWEHNERLQQDLNFPPPSDSDSDNSSILNNFQIKKPSIIEIPIKKIKSKHVRILDQPSINKNLTGKLNGMSLETILPETPQETGDILELHKRIQKEEKKFRAVARADIAKQSTPKV
ncbi:6574_t:CDS:1 [Ambispora gerdemannii]|uniref:6574_t:CDS:1 n=1 Tax=Ambispora gerdemannii TaxID=144530 RepID=A0A9N9D0T1_9GLOM|nr:6574_t:CDS:1 [Ambispora gerdemannii]